MKKNTLYVVSFVVAAMILQSFSPNSISSNYKDQKKQKNHDSQGNQGKHNDQHDNGHSKGHGHNNGGSININIDLGKDLKRNKGKKDRDEHGKGRDHNNGEHNGHSDYADNNERNNFGQQRAFEARNKHNKFKPNNEREAFEGIQIVISRNNFLLSIIEQKIEIALKKNKENRDNGNITAEVFKSNKRQIELFEARRVSLDLHISL